MLVIAFVAGVALTAALVVRPPPPAPSPSDSCVEPLDTCGTVTVPFDWTTPGDTREIEVAYGVLEPTGPVLGTLVLAAGGPGASGLASAANYERVIDARIRAAYRIVVFDVRGVGKSDVRSCPDTLSKLNIGDGRTRNAIEFAPRCLTEAGVAAEDADLYATTQVVEDLEAIRATVGAEQFALYGVSYGTVLAQAYAERYPERLSAMILDAPVDRTLTSIELWASGTHAGEATLEGVFDACRASPSCAQDLPDPERAYSRLMDRFAAGPLQLAATDSDGIPRQFRIRREAMEAVIFSFLYEPFDRMALQRALAASNRGDLVTLGSILGRTGRAAAIPDDQLVPIADPRFSEFTFYATSCGDYRVSPTDDPSDARAVIEAGEAAGVMELRMASLYFAQMPCLYWPGQPEDAERPEALSDTSFPTVVLTSTLDPITPASYGHAIVDALDQSTLIETDGGAHSTLWRGDPCVDDPIHALLVEQHPPARSPVRCSAAFAEPYLPLSPFIKDRTSALDVAVSLENELWSNGEFAYWDGIDPLETGCLRVGQARVTQTDDALSLEFVRCSHIPDVYIDGSGTYDLLTNVMELDLTIDGEQLSYLSSAEEIRVTGTYQGKRVDERL